MNAANPNKDLSVAVKTTRVALAIVLADRMGIRSRDAEPRILIAQRPAGAVRSGAWEFPGGKVEPGEMAADAAVRETWEELRLRIRIIQALAPHTHTYAHARVELNPFMAELVEPNQQPTLVHAAATAWVAPAELPVPGFLEGNLPILKAVRVYLAEQYPA